MTLIIRFKNEEQYKKWEKKIPLQAEINIGGHTMPKKKIYTKSGLVKGIIGNFAKYEKNKLPRIPAQFPHTNVANVVKNYTNKYKRL